MGYGWGAHPRDDPKETTVSTSDPTPDPRTDPQTQLDTDPVNAPDADSDSEGGATPADPATDT